jgi:Ca2+-binding RTX toxin-like protein
LERGCGHRGPRPQHFCRAASFDPKLKLRTGAGRDVAELSNGADQARGGAGPDVIMGCRGDDAISGGGGDDDLSGDRGSDTLGGGDGRDWLVGCQFDPDDRNFPADEPGSDELRGGGGSDFLYGCKGRDDYRAGSGSDRLNTRDRAAEPVRCATGRDLVYGDAADRLFSCERTTECTTDNFPFLPCKRRLSLGRIGVLRPF